MTTQQPAKRGRKPLKPYRIQSLKFMRNNGLTLADIHRITTLSPVTIIKYTR